MRRIYVSLKQGVQNLIVLVLGIIVALVLTEMFLIIFHPFPFRQKGNRIVLPANMSMEYYNHRLPGLDDTIIHTKNLLGFRGPAIPPDKDRWTSIIAVGGSTTECFYLSDGKDWPAILGKKLKQFHPYVWINNAGLDGHSTFGHHILLDDYIGKLHPDIILYMLGCNELERKDLSDFDRSLLKEGTNWKTYLENHSEVVSLFINFKGLFQARKLNLSHAPADIRELPLLNAVPHQEIRNSLAYHIPYSLQYADRLRSLMLKTKQEGIEPVLITQPSLVGEGTDDATGINLAKLDYCHPLGGQGYWEILEMYNEVSRQVAQELDVMLIDLAQEMPKSSILFYDCLHFTNEGSEVVAQLVFNKLNEIIDDYPP